MRYSTIYERVEERGGFKYIKLKSGRLLSFWDAHAEAEKGFSSMVRAMSRAGKLADDEYDLERLEWFIENLESYVKSWREVIDERIGRKNKEERISLLRNTFGRTPEEAAEFNKKADELERRLKDER